MNRLQRVSSILTLLSNATKLSTNQLAKEYQETIRVIQLDFKEYILPLFDDETIYYDYSIKCYLAKTNFLHRTLLSADELARIFFFILFNYMHF